LIPVYGQEDTEIYRVVGPSETELTTVQLETGLATDFLSAATDREERPRVETEGESKLLILRVPHEQPDSRVPFVTVAFGIVFTRQHIVSVCAEDSPVWNEVLSGQVKYLPVKDRFRFLCTLFLRIARIYLRYLQRIRSESDSVESEIHTSLKNERLIRMLDLEKSLVYFTTSLRAHEPIWERFRRSQERELTEEEQDLLEDVKIEFRQAQELADIYSNILSSMMDAFASVISNNLNVVMKFLTSVTIIVMIPTLVASIYGMNVELPFQHSPHAFVITMGISLLLSVAGVVIFLRKKFF